MSDSPDSARLDSPLCSARVYFFLTPLSLLRFLFFGLAAVTHTEGIITTTYKQSILHFTQFETPS